MSERLSERSRAANARAWDAMQGHRFVSAVEGDLVETAMPIHAAPFGTTT